MKRLTTFVLAAFILLPTLHASGEMKSGLQPGERTGAFYVSDITGPRKGDSLCYACAFGRRTVINIQTRTMNEELASLIQQIDKLVDPASQRSDDTKHGFVVYVTDDAESAADQLRKVADAKKIERVPLTVFDDPAGPQNYKLNSDAEVTVMMWTGQEVKFNHAFAAGELNADAIEKIVADAKKHLQ